MPSWPNTFWILVGVLLAICAIIFIIQNVNVG